MMKCLVTGATGLIGRAVVGQLEHQFDVYRLSRRPPAGTPDPNMDVVWDLSGPQPVHPLPEKMDTIIHLAQSEHFRDFPDFADDILNVNVSSTVRLLDYARRVGANKFIYASSGGIYGHGYEEFREDKVIQATGDLGYYLSTKLCSEILVESYTPFMTIVVLRFFFVYGPGQRQDMLIPRLVRSVLNDQPIALHGQDGIRINPTYVSDAAKAVIEAMALDRSEKFNIAGPEILTLREVAETIGGTVGRKPVFSALDQGVPPDLVGDIKKMTRMLSPPGVPFSEGIRRYLKDPDRDGWR